MKDFDITERKFLDAIGEPGTTRISIKEIDYTLSVVGQDADGDFIYEEITPELEEKLLHFKSFRVLLTRHTRKAEDRPNQIEGMAQRAVESSYYDSRIPEHRTAALHMVIGAAVAAGLDLK